MVQVIMTYLGSRGFEMELTRDSWAQDELV